MVCLPSSSPQDQSSKCLSINLGGWLEIMVYGGSERQQQKQQQATPIWIPSPEASWPTFEQHQQQQQATPIWIPSPEASWPTSEQQQPQRPQTTFLSLPLEIRQQIHGCLFAGRVFKPNIHNVDSCFCRQPQDDRSWQSVSLRSRPPRPRVPFLLPADSVSSYLRTSSDPIFQDLMGPRMISQAVMAIFLVSRQCFFEAFEMLLKVATISGDSVEHYLAQMSRRCFCHTSLAGVPSVECIPNSIMVHTFQFIRHLQFLVTNNSYRWLRCRRYLPEQLRTLTLQYQSTFTLTLAHAYDCPGLAKPVERRGLCPAGRDILLQAFDEMFKVPAKEDFKLTLRRSCNGTRVANHPSIILRLIVWSQMRGEHPRRQLILRRPKGFQNERYAPYQDVAADLLISKIHLSNCGKQFDVVDFDVVALINSLYKPPKMRSGLP